MAMAVFSDFKIFVSVKKCNVIFTNIGLTQRIGQSWLLIEPCRSHQQVHAQIESRLSGG